MALIQASGYGSQYANDLSRIPMSSSTNPKAMNYQPGEGSIFGLQAPEGSGLNLPSKSNFSGYLTGGNTGTFDTQVKNAGTGNEIDKESINNQFNNVNEAYQSQLPEVDKSLTRSVGLLKDALTGVQSQVGQSKVTAQQGFDDSVQQASDTAQSVQRKNRNVLRALGILGSSAAGEMLSAPMNEFDKQRASLSQALNTRVAQLDDFLNQKTNEHANQIAELTDKYTSLKQNILTDIRHNESERKNALKAADYAYRNRVNDIRNMQMQYESEVAMQKQNLATQWNGISQYTNPTADTNAINNATVNAGMGGNNSQQADIYNPYKKQQSITNPY